jgi:hypothetical protein
MATSAWLLAFLAVHLSLVGVAAYFLLRVDSYTKRQVVIQLVLALLIPLVGFVAVLVMASDALAPPPKPDSSRFDRNYIGSGD